MTIADRRREPRTPDDLIRTKILKLRWMGLDEEADILAEDWKLQIARYATIHADIQQTD
jgi:hypothetical protein